MKLRLLTATAVAGVCALTLSSAQAATPVLDGKKVKALTAETTPAAQDNDTVLVDDLNGVERVSCAPPKCSRLPFVFKPAKGVKGSLAFTITWSLPGEDYDLYVAEIAKDGTATQLATCGATAGTSEKVELPMDAFKPGKTYALITYNFRSSGTSKVTSKVSFPGSAPVKETVPAAVNDLVFVNCGL